MKILKTAAAALLAVAGLVLIAGILVPDTYRVERTAVIQAPPEFVFRHVQFWRNWQEWLPWAEQDTSLSVAVVGQDGEPGAAYQWSGKNAGKGEMTSTGVSFPERFEYRLRFAKPWKSEASGFWALADSAGRTFATWGFEGRMPYPFNALRLFMQLEKRIGRDLDRGLARLTSVCEKQMADVSGYAIQDVRLPARTYLAVRKTIGMSGMQEFFAESYGRLTEAMEKNRIRAAGAPCGLYYAWDEAIETSDMAAAVPVAGNPTLPGFTTIRLPAGKAYATDYRGSYDKSQNAHLAFELFFNANGVSPKLPCIEEYITDPSREADSAKWLTRIYYYVE